MRTGDQFERMQRDAQQHSQVHAMLSLQQQTLRRATHALWAPVGVGGLTVAAIIIAPFISRDCY